MAVIRGLPKSHINSRRSPASIPYVKMHRVKFVLKAVARQPIEVRTPSINMAVLQLHLSMMILDTGPINIRKPCEKKRKDDKLKDKILCSRVKVNTALF